MKIKFDRFKRGNRLHSDPEVHLGRNDILALIIAFLQILLLPFILFLAMVLGIYLLILKLA